MPVSLEAKSIVLLLCSAAHMHSSRAAKDLSCLLGGGQTGVSSRVSMYETAGVKVSREGSGFINRGLCRCSQQTPEVCDCIFQPYHSSIVERWNLLRSVSRRNLLWKHQSAMWKQPPSLPARYPYLQQSYGTAKHRKRLLGHSGRGVDLLTIPKVAKLQCQLALILLATRQDSRSIFA